MITICVALQAELPDGIKGDFNVIYTGVGKIQAPTRLAKHLADQNKPNRNLELWNSRLSKNQRIT